MATVPTLIAGTLDGTDDAERPNGIMRGLVAAGRRPALVFLSGAAVFGVMAWLAFATKVPQPPITLAANLAIAGATAIGNLLVVALVLERALAAFDQLFFGAEISSAREKMVSDPTSSAPADTDVRRERARLILGLTAGFFISAAGVRTLANLTTNPGQFTPTQVAVDICLTAGLLAGGSNALAKLIDVLKERAAQNVSASRLQSAQAEAARQALRPRNA